MQVRLIRSGGIAAAVIGKLALDAMITQDVDRHVVSVALSRLRKLQRDRRSNISGAADQFSYDITVRDQCLVSSAQFDESMTVDNPELQHLLELLERIGMWSRQSKPP